MMNNHDTGESRGWRRWPRRAGIPAVAAAVAVLAAACGSASSSASSASGLSAYQQALAYTQCMRAHGVADYPDPNANGTTAINSSIANGSQFQAASNACQHLQPGGNLSPAQTQQNLMLDLRLAECMRTHGYPNTPDPGGYATGTAPVSKSAAHAQQEQTQTPQYQAALRTCQSLLHIPPKPGRP